MLRAVHDACPGRDRRWRLVAGIAVACLACLALPAWANPIVTPWPDYRWRVLREAVERSGDPNACNALTDLIVVDGLAALDESQQRYVESRYARLRVCLRRSQGPGFAPQRDVQDLVRRRGSPADHAAMVEQLRRWFDADVQPRHDARWGARDGAHPLLVERARAAEYLSVVWAARSAAPIIERWRQRDADSLRAMRIGEFDDTLAWHVELALRRLRDPGAACVLVARAHREVRIARDSADVDSMVFDTARGWPRRTRRLTSAECGRAWLALRGAHLAARGPKNENNTLPAVVVHFSNGMRCRVRIGPGALLRYDDNTVLDWPNAPILESPEFERLFHDLGAEVPAR